MNERTTAEPLLLFLLLRGGFWRWMPHSKLKNYRSLWDPAAHWELTKEALCTSCSICDCLYSQTGKLIACLNGPLSLQRPAGHPEDRVWLGDWPGATQRPCAPRGEGSQGGFWYQGSSPSSGAVQHSGLASTSTSVDLKPIFSHTSRPGLPLLFLDMSMLIRLVSLCHCCASASSSALFSHHVKNESGYWR